MKLAVHEFGNDKNRLVVIDDFLPYAERYIDMAAALAPFPTETVTGYPGLRLPLTPDLPASAYVRAVVQTAGPVIAEVFDAAGYQILNASFAIVTKRPSELNPLQRVPHRDSTDPNFLAILHHLHHVPGTGTNFYRHKRTGFERMTEERRAAYDEAFAQDNAEYGSPGYAYMADTDQRFERIQEGPAIFNRVLIYRGSLLHSGQIPEDFPFDPNPRTGRLTGMVFMITAPRAGFRSTPPVGG
jgi:hypothetical protein